MDSMAEWSRCSPARSPGHNRRGASACIDAAMALGLDGGYDAVQMRDVAARADVAMGTVYRYFTSKDHLLAATLVYWVGAARRAH